MTEFLDQINFDNIENDLSCNRDLVKTVINEGHEWKSPKFKDIIEIHFKIGNNTWLCYNGELDGDLIPLEICECLTTMTINEYSKFTCEQTYLDQDRFDEFLNKCVNSEYKKLNSDFADFNLENIFLNNEVVIEIKLQSVFTYHYINDETTKYICKSGTNVTNPAPFDEVSIRYVNDSIIDNPTCLDNVDITTERLNIIDINNILKSSILSSCHNEIWVIQTTDGNYTVELLDWHRIYMLDIDKDIYMKKIVTSDLTNQINYEDDVTYKLDNKLTTYTIGNGEIEMNIEKCLYNMNKGEEVLIYNEDKTITNLKLVDCKSNSITGKLKSDEKYNLALKRKLDGNELFKKQMYNLAIVKYKYGLEIIKDLGSVIEKDLEDKEDNISDKSSEIDNQFAQSIKINEDKKVCEIKDDIDTNKSIEINDKSITLNVKKLHISLMMNIVQCFFKLDDYSNVITMSSEILKLDSNNIKTLYRKGHAYLQKNDTDKAKECLLKAKKLDSNNKEIDKILIELNNQIKINNLKDKETFKDIFKK